MDTPAAPQQVGMPRGALILPLLLLVLFAWAIIHTAQTRSSQDFLRYSLGISVLMLIASIVFVVIEWRNDEKRNPGGPTEFNLQPFLAVPLAGPMYYSIAASLKDICLWLLSPKLSGTEAVVWAVVFTVVLGAILFTVRLRYRSCYGVVETLTGLVVAAQRVAIATAIPAAATTLTRDPAFFLTILTAAVYLVVRGFDNIHQGLTKEPFDRVALKFTGRVTSFLEDPDDGYKDSRPIKRK